MTDPDPDDRKIVAFRTRPDHDADPAALPPDADGTGPSRGSIAALIFAAVLVLVGWVLVHKLSASSRIEDCLMAGRSNCAPIDRGR